MNTRKASTRAVLAAAQACITGLLAGCATAVLVLIPSKDPHGQPIHPIAESTPARPAH